MSGKEERKRREGAEMMQPQQISMVLVRIVPACFSRLGGRVRYFRQIPASLLIPHIGVLVRSDWRIREGAASQWGVPKLVACMLLTRGGRQNGTVSIINHAANRVLLRNHMTCPCLGRSNPDDTHVMSTRVQDCVRRPQPETYESAELLAPRHDDFRPGF